MCFPNKCSCSWKARTVWGEEPWCIANVLLLGRLLKSLSAGRVLKRFSVMCLVMFLIDSYWEPRRQVWGSVPVLPKTNWKDSSHQTSLKTYKVLIRDMLWKFCLQGLKLCLSTELTWIFFSVQKTLILLKKQILTTKLPRHRTVVSNSQVSWLEF